MSKIETELCEALDVKTQLKKEDRPTYLRRLAKTCTALWFPKDGEEEPEGAGDKWDGLTEKTQAWVNAATTALEDKEDIADFEDSETQEKDTKMLKKSQVEDTEADTDEDDEDAAEAKPVKKAKAKTEKKTEKAPAKAKEKESSKKATKPAKEEKPAPKASKKEDKATPAKGSSGRPKTTHKSGISGYTMIRQIMREDMKMKTKDLIEKLEKKGYTLSKAAVQVIRSNFIQTCQELKAAGHLKNLPL